MCFVWVVMDGMFEIFFNMVDVVDSIYFFGVRVWSCVVGSELWEFCFVCFGLRIVMYFFVEVWFFYLLFLIICFVKNLRN